MTAKLTSADFARIQLMPSVWVVAAGRPLRYQLGTAYGLLEMAFEKEKARIFVMQSAVEICGHLARLFPDIKLEPATFEQWVEQQAG